MRLYTISLYNKSEAEQLDIPVLDTTVKSGDVAFAPSWDIVMRHKRSLKRPADDEEYRKVFWAMMRVSYRVHRDKWDWLLAQDRIALGRYCPAGKFCHRLELVDILSKITTYLGIEFIYEGELR